MKLAKTLRVPDVEYIKDLEDVKRYLRELTTELQSQHAAIYNDLRIQDAVYFIVDGVRWRLTVSGNNLVVQKYESKVWTTKFTFEPS